MGVGTRVNYVARFLGREIDSVSEITGYEPNKRYAWKVVSGPVSVGAEATFESVGSGTRLSLIGEGDPGGFFRLAEPIVGRMARRQMEADCENLKDLLESEGQ